MEYKGIIIGIVIAYALLYLLKLYGKGWEIVTVGINPKTGRSYLVKEKGGRRRYYVNEIRVPLWLYERL